MGLCVVGDGEGGIFFVQTVQADTDLIFLATGLRSDSLGENGFCEGDGVQSHALGADGVVGLELVHLCDGADVASGDALDFLDGLLAAHDIHTAHLFAVAGTAVGQRCVAGQGAIDDLDIGVLAILVGNGLEHEGHGIAVAYGQLDGLAVCVSACHGQTFGGVGNQVDDSLHKGLGAQAGESAAAEHGDQGAFLDAGTQASGHFFCGEFFALEELFHQFFAGLRHVLHQSHVGFFHSIGSVSGDVLCHGLVLVHGVGLLAHHVDDAGDLFPFKLGDDQRRDGVAELLLELCHDSVEVAVVFVGLGDVNQAGQIPRLDLLVSALCAHGDIALCGQNDDGSVSHLQGGQDIAVKVEVARSIQHIDLAAAELHRSQSGSNGDLTLDFFGIIVTDCVAVRGLAQAVSGTSQIQHTFSKHGFAHAGVTQQADVTDIRGGIAHITFSP